MSGRVKEIRTISDAGALREVAALFSSAEEELYYIDIADRLRLPLPQVVQACEKLIARGAILVGGWWLCRGLRSRGT